MVPEPSPSEKEMTRLKARVKELESEEPNLTLKLNFGVEPPVRIFRVEKLSAEQQKALASKVLAENRRVLQRQPSFPMIGLDFEYDSNYDDKYDTYRIQSVPKYAASAHRFFEVYYGQVPFTFELSNTGHLQAESLVPTLRATGGTYDGEHEAIVNDEVFAAAGAPLKAQTPNRRDGAKAQSRHLLTGLLFDETCDRLSPVFTVKDGKRYRYYISNRLETTTAKDASGWRLPADELERTILHQLDAMLRDNVKLSELAGMLVPAIPVQAAIARVGAVRDAIHGSSPQQINAVRRLVRSIHIKPNEMVLKIDSLALFNETGGTGPDQAAQHELDPVAISVPMTLRRRGAEAKLVLEGQSPSRKPNDGLVEALAKAHIMLGMLTEGSGRTIADVANDVGVHVADASRILPLTFLAPKITDAILRGRQPVELTARALMRDDLPHLWTDQLQQFGV